MTGRGPLRAGLAAALTLLAAVAWLPLFGRSAAAVLAGVVLPAELAGAVLSVAAAGLVLAAATRLEPAIRLLAELAVLAGYVLLVAAPGAAVVDGPKRLLTSAYPVDASGPELATVLLVTGLAALGAVEPALRRRAALLPVLAPLLLLVGGCALTASTPPPPWVAPAFAAGAAALLAAARIRPPAGTPAPGGQPPGVPASGVPAPGRAHPTAPGQAGAQAPGRAGRRVAGVVVPVLVAVAAVAALAGPGVTARLGRTDPLDARQAVPQPVTPRRDTSPLVLYPALRTGKARLAVTVTSREPLDRLRYATLDRFDGGYWTTGASFRRAGRALPLGPTTTAPVRRDEVTVRVDQAGPLAWLLTPGRPTRVSVAGLGVDEATGDVIVPAGGTVPAEYTVDSARPVPGAQLLADATPAGQPAGQEMPEAGDLAGRAARIADGAYGYPALLRLADHFAHDGGYAVATGPRAPAGHGLYQIHRLLTDRRGTAEQYASAFAVLARLLGYDARVVVGFRTGDGRRTGAGYRYEVGNADVTAWPEVRFDGVGWVPFAPVPAKRSAAPGPRPTSTPRDEPTPSASARAAAPVPSAGAPGTGTDGTAGTSLTPYVAGAGALGGLLVLLLAAVPVLKAVRRRGRRHAADPARRTVGAWHDALDTLADHGIRPAPGATSGEVVAAVPAGYGAAPAGLAALRDAALFAPVPVAPAAAETAWQHADGVRRAARAAASPPRRLLAAVRPHRLLRRPE
ncbi:MAG TPA: transglutaminaseTgpA domain-containing protein [Actinocatenispora sp.]